MNFIETKIKKLDFQSEKWFPKKSSASGKTSCQSLLKKSSTILLLCKSLVSWQTSCQALLKLKKPSTVLLCN